MRLFPCESGGGGELGGYTKPVVLLRHVRPVEGESPTATHRGLEPLFSFPKNWIARVRRRKKKIKKIYASKLKVFVVFWMVAGPFVSR